MFKGLWPKSRKSDHERRRRETLERIERSGWTAIYVGDYATSPTWAYTIGCHATLGAPEVVVFDIPMAWANEAFHEVYKDLKSGNLVLRDGDQWRPGQLEPRMVWREVHASRLYDNDPEQPWLALAEDYGKVLAPEKGPVRAFQLVAPDQHDRMPWEQGYDESLRARQRALWEPVSLAAGAAV